MGIEDMEIELRSQMDQLYLQKTKEIMRYDRKHMVMPMFGCNTAGSRGNIAATIAARAAKNNHVGGDSSSTPFNIGAAAAARGSSMKKKSSNQPSNDIMKNHAMLLNEAVLKRSKNQS